MLRLTLYIGALARASSWTGKHDPLGGDTFGCVSGVLLLIADLRAE
jgi:hypothetical protein